MGLYFEEFSVGQKIVTEKRTITENDIMTFADYQAMIIASIPTLSSARPALWQAGRARAFGSGDCFGPCLADRHPGWHGDRVP